MYLKHRLDEYHLSTLCNELSKKSKSFITANLADKDHKVFILENDGVTFDITYAAVYTLGKAADGDTMQKFIGEHLSDEQIESLLDILYKPRIPTVKNKSKLKKAKDKKSSNKSKDADSQCNTKYTAIHSLVDSGLSSIMASLIDVIKEPNEIILNILSESMHVALYSMWGEECGDILPSFVHFQCALLYYWAYKNNSCIATYIEEKESAKNKAKKKTFESKRREYMFAKEYRKEIGEDETLEQFLTRLFNDEQMAKFAIKYLSLCAHSSSFGTTEYIFLDEYLSTMKEYRKRNKRLDDFVTKEVEALGKDGVFEIGDNNISMLEKLGMTKDEIVMTSTSTCLEIKSVLLIYESGGAYAYIHYQHAIIKANFDKDVYRTYQKHLTAMLYEKFYMVRHYFVIIASSQYGRIIRDKRKAIEDKDRANFRVDQLEKLNQELKGKVKAIKKELDAEKAAKNQISTELTQYKNRDKLGITIAEYDNLRGQVEALKGKLDWEISENSGLSRALAKKDKELEQLRSDIDSHRDTIKSLEKANEVKIEADETLETIKRYNRIPIDNFINVINQYKVTLVGGDPMFNQIREKGITSIKCISTEKNTVTAEELVGSDLIVIATFYLDHPTTYAATAIAKTNNIKLLRCNNKNVDMLVYDIFEAVTT